MNKPFLRFCLCALLLALGPASAEPGHGRGGPPPAARPDAPPEQDRLRQNEERQRQEAERRPPKLSPEERKELRQQIHEAGHDLYRQKRHQQ